MFSLIREGNRHATSFPHESAYGFMVLGEDGGIIAGNAVAIKITQLFTKSKLRPAVVVGKKLSDIIGSNYEHTLIGACVINKKSLHGRYLIGDQLYLVIIDRVEEANGVHYEAFYFPIRDEDEHHSKGDPLFQNIAHDAAKGKGYVDIDWTKAISNAHAKQLVDCLNRQEHTTRPGCYCPFRRKCGFNDVYGWIQLERRSYYRTKVNIDGEVYLLALKDKEVPRSLSSKKVLCTALDISLGGVKLQAGLTFPVESTLKMVFDVFSCCGTVRWNQKQEDDWLIGVQFDALNAQQRSNIIRVITANRIRLAKPKLNK